MSEILRIGNASGFYGDRFAAFREMLDGGPLDVLTGDYLAELTMGILGRDRATDPTTGYAKTFLRQAKECLGTAIDHGTRIVVNAGGLNPAALAAALAEIDPRAKIAYVTGDEIERPGALAANAYLGAFGIAECLAAGADVVVTGRVTDASLVIGPAIARFGWGRDDLDALAGATVAGHVLECGAQATGGNYAFFREIKDMRRPGFPVAEISADGSSVITKQPGAGGAVTVDTITAQLLYEVESPHYLGPDVVTHLDTVTLTADGEDRVRITGAKGSPPPSTLKVGVARLGGFRNSMTFVLCGLDLDAKAELVEEQLTGAIGGDGVTFDRIRIEDGELLRAHITDRDRNRAGRAFSQAAVELALASYPGATLTTPPGDASAFAVFKAETAPQAEVPHTAVLPDGRRLTIDPPKRTAEIAPPPPPGEPTPHPAAERTRRAPLGEIVGARAGDKGGDANLGVWVRTDAAYAWLVATLSTDRLRGLLPEAAGLPIERYPLPNLRAINFVLRGLLGSGGAGASTRFDPQAKALGELLRSRIVEIPEDLS